MTAVPETPAAGPLGPSPTEPDVAALDAESAWRARSAGEYLAGLIAHAELATVARPDLLPQDQFPDDDPEVVRRVWERALAVGLYAGRVSSSPRLYRDQMAGTEAVLEAIGFHAMGRLVGGARRLVAPEHVHPADVEGPRERRAV